MTSAASDRARAVLDYHERTKHHFHRMARSSGFMEWANQPDPFRRYAGAGLVSLPLASRDPDLGYDGLYASAAPAADSSPVLAMVNCKPVTQQMYDMHLRQRQIRRPTDEQNNNRELVLEEVINLELVNQDAERKGIADRPDVSAQLAQQRRALLAGIAMQEYVKDHPVEDADLQAHYDKQFGASQEFMARHILLNSRDAAVAAIGSLDKGEDFAELAKQHSTGPSKSVGGDLGWFEADQMVPEFAAATAQLSNGSYTKEPVKTQFGWHVILREDSREVPKPDLATARPEIEAEIRQEHVAQMVRDIRAKADIEVKGPGGEQ